MLLKVNNYTKSILITMETPVLEYSYKQLKVIEKCTNLYFGTEKLPPKF